MSELVTDYLEGDLPLRRRLAARLHLLRCDGCVAYFAQMRRTARLLGEGPPAEPAAAVQDDVLRKAGDRSPGDTASG
jgi:anti-sigma factor RsiW